MELNEAKKLIDVWNSVESELENIFIDELLEAQALVTEDRVRKDRDKHWADCLEAHRKHCSAQGNKELTKVKKLSPKQA